MTRRLVAAVVVLVLVLAGLTLWLNRPDDPPRAAPAPAPTTTTPVPTTPAPTGPCSDPATAGFTPTSITIPDVVTAAKVLALPRDASNLPSTPPLSDTGKHEFAWDRPPGIEPGTSKGNVLLNAHTWPDDSALGNAMLDGLHDGDRIIVKGHGKTLCYRVTQRVEVLASKGLVSYYAKDGPPQLAIVVCSGTRLGPDNWTKRTIWFASPEPATAS